MLATSEALAETKALAMESSFGGMGFDDAAYARLVRMHSTKRQTDEASRRAAPRLPENAPPTGRAPGRRGLTMGLLSGDRP